MSSAFVSRYAALIFAAAVGILFYLYAAFSATELAPMARALQPLVDRQTVAGVVVLVATPDKILDREAFGYADIDTKRAMRTSDMFWIASMTKPMTAAALMMLVDEGRVSLDDPVEKYLPAFKNMQVNVAPPGSPPALVPATHPITIREILSHTAGLDYRSKLDDPAIDSHPLAECVDRYATDPLVRQPGGPARYSNEGLNIAGRIIEVVSGEPYEKFMQERLLDPLGMVDTTFHPTPAQMARIATSYRANAARTGLERINIAMLTYPLDGPGRYAMPAGGLFSTAADVVKFCQMFAHHGAWKGRRFLSEQSWNEMRTRQSPPGPLSVGLGWQVSPDGVFHTGAYQTFMQVDLRREWIIIALVQQDGEWPNGLANFGVVVDNAAKKIFAAQAPR